MNIISFILGMVVGSILYSLILILCIAGKDN